jgi:hypothetical protein
MAKHASIDQHGRCSQEGDLAVDPTDVVIEKVKQREIAGVFHSPEALDGAVKALLHQGFDRADIDFMASQDAVREKLGGV